MSKWNPDDHLPECGVTRYPICICDRLRACEQRIRIESQAWHWKQGHDVGLDAAEVAVAALTKWPDSVEPDDLSFLNYSHGVRDAFTAIRALKEKP